MKKPRLFYYEDAEDAWIPAPDLVEQIISVDNLSDGDTLDIKFKRLDMTEAEFNNLPES